MNNTERSFKDKWTKNPELVFKETLNPDSDFSKWILGRNGFANIAELKKFLSDKKRILDGGCGNGRITALLRESTNPDDTEIVGIDLVSADVARANLSCYKNIKIYQKNLLDDLSDLDRFDYIYSQEVLHHTGDAEKAFLNLSKLLNDKGVIAIYVYKKKGPLREFADEYIREKIVSLEYPDAMKVCDQITEFGKQLSEYKIKIKVPAVDILEIPEGEYDLQRFIYNFIMKCYWNPECSFQANSVINYDWYHPQNCTKHTVEEVRRWFEKAGLKIMHECVDYYGITVSGAKC